jgi:hypothetical protein
MVLIGLALWFALAVWGFAGPGDTDYLLVIVSGFVCIVVALLQREGARHESQKFYAQGRRMGVSRHAGEPLPRFSRWHVRLNAFDSGHCDRIYSAMA